MRIAILGTGNVGTALARPWAEMGHDVVFGTRDPDSTKSVAAADATGARVETVRHAVQDADVVVLAVPWSAANESLRACGDLAGKVVVDCTNPLTADLGLELGHTTSGGERVARWARGARVVKAFNTTGAENMRRPRYGDRRLTMMIAGDDPEAKDTVQRLAAEVGFEPIDLGPLKASRLLEPFALTWITLAHKAGLGRDFALQVLKRG